MKRRFAFLITLLLAILILGCGGGSGHSGTNGSANAGSTNAGSTDGGSTPTLAAPSIAVEWPARTRGLEAPGTAGVAEFKLSNPTTAESVLAFTGARPAGAAASVQSYVGPQTIATGDYVLDVTFRVATNGTITATASLPVRLAANGSLTRPDGTPLGTIAYQGAVYQVTVYPGQTLDVGQTRDLTFVSLAGLGQVYAAPYGAARIEVVSGTGLLRVNADGSLTGLATGESRVRVTVDRVTSAETVVRVNGPALPTQVLDFTGRDLVSDPSSGAVWASYDSPSGGTVARIDGSVSIPVGADPTVMAISDDGSTMAVGLRAGGEVQYVDLRAQTAGARFTLPFFASASSLAFAPGSASVLAVGTRSTGTAASGGVAIYDGTVRRDRAESIRDALSIHWISGSLLVAASEDSIFDVNVDAAGGRFFHLAASTVRNADDPRELWNGPGRIYTSSGAIFDLTSFAPLAPIPGAESNATVFPIAGPVAQNNVAWYVFGTAVPRLRAYRLDSAGLLDDRALDVPGGAVLPSSTGRLVRWGAKGLAFQSGAKLVLIDDVPGL